MTPGTRPKSAWTRPSPRPKALGPTFIPAWSTIWRSSTSKRRWCGWPNYPAEPSRPAVDGNVTIYHAQPHGNRDPLGNPVQPSLFVDVTGVIEAKTAMLACHKSQKQWLDTSQGLDSYLDTMKDLMRDVGRMSGRFEYAEGWRRHLHLGFCGEGDDPIAEALAKSCHVR
jgi:hypothetical protein